uniref:MFS domain-containing protein n=1 Tax=Macrostomum lignano TaxID=282301 RepID=A0A1I8GEZ4_9PLAT
GSGLRASRTTEAKTFGCVRLYSNSFISSSSSAMKAASAAEAPVDPSIDRGWAWVIAVAVCIINIVTLGSIRCLGILVNSASLEFSLKKRDSSVIFSVTYVTFTVFSMVFIVMTRLVSCRILIFIGGLLTSGGLCLAYFLPTPAALSSGTANPAILLLNQYFDRYRSRANGIAFAGGPIGSFLMPPLLTHLMTAYTFRGAMLLWGGITLHTCAAACLMRPKPPPPSEKPSEQLRLQPEPQREPEQPAGPAFGAGFEDSVPFAESDDEEQQDGTSLALQPHPARAADGSTGADQKQQEEAEAIQGANGNSVEAGNGDIRDEEEQRPLTPASTKNKQTANPKAEPSMLSSACSLFRLPVYYAVGAVLTMGLCGLLLTFYIVPLYGREIGLDGRTTSMLLLLQGIPDLVSRLLSALWFILLLTPSYAGLLFFTLACGLFGGVVIADTHPLAISQLGLENYRAAFATYSIMHGGWMLCMPVLL